MGPEILTTSSHPTYLSLCLMTLYLQYIWEADNELDKVIWNLEFLNLKGLWEVATFTVLNYFEPMLPTESVRTFIFWIFLPAKCFLLSFTCSICDENTKSISMPLPTFWCVSPVEVCSPRDSHWYTVPGLRLHLVVCYRSISAVAKPNKVMKLFSNKPRLGLKTQEESYLVFSKSP